MLLIVLQMKEVCACGLMKGFGCCRLTQSNQGEMYCVTASEANFIRRKMKEVSLLFIILELDLRIRSHSNSTK